MVLERIADWRASRRTRYAALGVVDDNGDLVKFIPVGMTPEEIRRTGSPPIGKGMIGAIGNERSTIRVADIRDDRAPRASQPVTRR